MSRLTLTLAGGAAALIASAFVAGTGNAQSGAAVGTANVGTYAVARARARSADEAMFLTKCQYCHVEMGPGTVVLSRRMDPKVAKLADRTDLQADYVKAIVRNGLNSMPPINRAEVSDAELEQIARYLSSPKSGAAKSPPAKASK